MKKSNGKFKDFTGMAVKVFNGASVAHGASMAQWSVRSPFTSEIAGSILSGFDSRAKCSTHVKRVSQHSAESRGFRRALRFPPTVNTNQHHQSQES